MSKYIIHRFNLWWPVLVVMAAVVGLWRIGQLTHYAPLYNFTPLGAIALFGAAYLRRKGQAFVLPLLILFLSDLMMCHVLQPQYSAGFLYKGWWWTYLAFVCMVFWGQSLLNKISVWRIGLGGVAAAGLHWLISDIGPCFGSKDTLSMVYVWNCYLSAIPWSLRFLYGTWVYSALIFGVFALLKYRIPILLREKP